MKQSIMAAGASMALAAALLSSGASMATARPAALPHNNTVVMALPPQTDINWYFPVVDIASNSLYAAWLWNMGYQSLITLKPDGAFNWSASIASHVAVNASNTVFTVTMNKKWHWSNGDPVTSQNVLTTWQLLQDTSAKNAPAPWPYTGAGTGDITGGVKSVTTQGNYQFTVTLKKPANKLWFIYSGLNQLEPYPSVWLKYPTNPIKEDNWLAKAATEPTLPEYKIIDGPYQLTKAVNDQYWDFTANPNYDGHKPQVKHVDFLYESSSTAEFAALKTGQIQFGYLPLSMWASRKEITGDKLWTMYPLQFNDLLVNMNESKTKVNNAPDNVGPLFNQLYIRQAVQLGIDQPAIIKAGLNGNGVDEYTAIATKTKSEFMPPGLKALYPYNPARGKKLLLDHGWKDVGGVMTKGSQKLSFTLDYASGDNFLENEVTLIKLGLAQEGIQVKLNPETFNTLIAMKPDQWEMQDYGGIDYGGSYPTGDGIFQQPGQGLDTQGYYSPEMVKLINASLQPGTTKQSLQALYKYLDFVAKDLPIEFTPAAPTYEEESKDLHGVQSSFNPFEEEPSPAYWYYSK